MSPTRTMLRATKQVQRNKTKRRVIMAAAFGGLLIVPLLLWLVDWPLSLVAVIPIVVVSMWILAAVRNL